MLEAIEQAPGWELDVVGPVAARDQERLDSWLASSPAAARVRMHGRMPPATAWELARGAWAGMSLLHSTPAFESAIPSKIYEYLACGMPVLSSPIKRAAELVEKAGAGAVAADAAQAGATLTAWSGASRAEFELLRDAAKRWIDGGPGAVNPHDQFAEAVVQLLTGSRRDQADAARSARRGRGGGAHAMTDTTRGFDDSVRIAASADVDERATIGSGSSVWHLAQVREQAVLGRECVIGRGAYIGTGVKLGDNVKVQNYALVYEPAEVGDGAFIGPAAVFTNDHRPRSVDPDGKQKRAGDWHAVGVTVGEGGLDRRPSRVRRSGAHRPLGDGRGGRRRHDGRARLRARRRRSGAAHRVDPGAPGSASSRWTPRPGAARRPTPATARWGAGSWRSSNE